MAKLFEASIQIVTDDKDRIGKAYTADKVQAILEGALGHLKISEVFVRETEYVGELDNDDEEDDGPPF